MKKNIIKRISCILMLGVLIAFIPARFADAKTTYDFEVSLNAGYGQKVLLGYGAPFEITVTNKNTSNFEGCLQLIIPGFSNNNILYEEDIALGAGETKTVQIVAGIPIPAEFVNIRMTNKRYKVLWSDLQKINVSKTKNDIRVGVLSDDFSALGYMDRVHFLSDAARYTSLVELSAADFPVNFAALDMLDVILISDFSTDLLTKEQMNALNLWVKKGGLLVIGTGSTANKTLSGLYGNLLNEKVTATTSQETTLGLATEDYSYISQIGSGTNSYSPYDGFYEGYYYYDFDYYTDPSNYYDLDGDGMNDYIFTYGGSYDDKGNFTDAYGNPVDPANVYLFENNAFYTDADGSYHYKYYDERYGYVSETLDELLNYYAFTEEEMSEYGYPEYCNLLGFDPKWYLCEQLGITDESDLDEAFEEYFGDDFREFLRHYTYLFINYIYNGYDFRPDLSVDGNAVISNNYKYLNIDCAGIDETLTRSSDEIIYGDTADGKTYPLAKVIKSGDGKVILCAVDFTKNPIPKNSSSGEFFRNLIEKIAGAELINEAVEYENQMGNSYYYSYGTGYSEKSLLKSAASAPVPPLIFYVTVILLYFVAILVTYVVCLKKKKTWNLWVIYPVSAMAVAVLIFCLGFSTRVLRLNTNIITLLFPDSISTQETDFVNVTVPKAKEYVIDFSSEVEVDRNYSAGGSYYYSSSDIDYDTYSVRYRSDYDHIQSVIANKVALESQVFKAEAAYPTQGGIDVSLKTDLSIGGKVPQNISVTNNYSTVLEDVIVQLYTSKGYEDYYFKKIKPGETVVASAGKFIDDSKTSYYSSTSYTKLYSNSLSNHYNKNKSMEITAGIFLGNLYRGFNETIRRRGVLDYIQEEYSPDNDHFLVVAFPKSDIAAKVTEGKKSKQTRTEAIIVFDNYKNLQVK
ncbi:MAG: hypothetical protein J6X80_03070 [Lachnospiraceae bacterium]|nr:hypothetical protein [Lachnospiraceae bacterium]